VRPDTSIPDTQGPNMRPRAQTMKNRKQNKKSEKGSKAGSGGRKPRAVLRGTATANALVQVEVRITDATYEVGVWQRFATNWAIGANVRHRITL
jgi:hypothetical protein